LTEHEVVGHEEWLEARKELLAKEKEFTRASCLRGATRAAAASSGYGDDE